MAERPLFSWDTRQYVARIARSIPRARFFVCDLTETFKVLSGVIQDIEDLDRFENEGGSLGEGECS